MNDEKSEVGLKCPSHQLGLIGDVTVVYYITHYSKIEKKNFLWHFSNFLLTEGIIRKTAGTIEKMVLNFTDARKTEI